MVRCRIGLAADGGPFVAARALGPVTPAFDGVLFRAGDAVVCACSATPNGESGEVLKFVAESSVADLRLPRFLPKLTSRSSDRCPWSAYCGCSEGLLRAEVNSSLTGKGVKFAT